MRISSFLFLFLASLITLKGQSDIKRIAIIPFDRFSFDSAHEMDEIYKCNDLKNANLVYDAYVSEIVSHISDSSSTNFFILSEADVSNILNHLPKVYKYEPISHFGVNVEPIIKSGLYEQIAKNMKVDAFLFLTKYKIEGKLLTTRKAYGGSKFLDWSLHLIDYELYDLDGNLVALANNLSLKPRNPNEETYTCKGTLLPQMRKAYATLGKDVENKIEKYKTKKKPIYKIKKN